LVVTGGQDHVVDASGFVDEHGFAFSQGANAAKTVFDFCGGDAHDNSFMGRGMAISWPVIFALDASRCLGV
jgi:hypothetical protein